MTTSKPGLFLRTTSGLRRDWKPIDLFIFNWMAGSFIFTTFIFSGMAQVFGSFPGANLYLAVILGGAGAIPVLLTYALLSASMPRSGGDYVWVSRLLSPVLAFMYTFTAGTIATILWNPFNGYNAASIGFASAFGLVGKLTGDASWTNAAAWFSGNEGQYIVVILTFVIPALMISFGMKAYAWIQRGIFFLALAAYFVMVGLLLVYSRSSFIGAYNVVAGAGGYQTVLDTAKSTGIGSSNFSLYDTLVWAAYYAVGYAWMYAGAPLLGEVKNASNLRNMTLAYLLPPIFSVLMFSALFAGLFSTVGDDFMRSLGFLLANGNQVVTGLPFQPYFIYLPALLLNGFPSAVIGVVVLIMVAMVLSALYYNVANILISTRYFFAQSFDRVLPSALARVETRWATPWVAIVVVIVGSMLWWVYSLTYPGVWLFFSAAGISIFIMNLMVCLTGMLFPFRNPTVYLSSPLAKYKVGGAPAISITGFAGVIYALVFMYAYLAIPALGVSGYPPSFVILIAVFVAAGLYYYVVKWYRLRHGIDISLAFQEIPPD